MRLPALYGLIRRRLLVNFRVDAEVMGRFLPAPTVRNSMGAFAPLLAFCPQLAGGDPPRMASAFLLASPARTPSPHRRHWDDSSGHPGDGVFISRRDTVLPPASISGGGRIFPGEHHLADFAVSDEASRISLSIRARDGRMALQLRAHESDSWPASSCFESLAASSCFFENGSLGYSVTRDCRRLDGIRLQIRDWRVRPLVVEQVESSFFSDESIFPAGSVTFDHALVMRDLSHEWHQVADMVVKGSSSALN